MLDLLRAAAESGAATVIVLAFAIRGIVKIVLQAKPSLMRASDKREAARQALHGRNKAEREQGLLVLELLERTKRVEATDDRSSDDVDVPDG